MGEKHSPYFNCQQLKSNSFSSRDCTGLSPPPHCSQAPIHFAPEIPDDVRVTSLTADSSESMMRSARNSGVDRRAGDRILKPRVNKRSEKRQRERCFEIRREGEEDRNEEQCRNVAAMLSFQRRKRSASSQRGDAELSTPEAFSPSPEMRC